MLSRYNGEDSCQHEYDKHCRMSFVLGLEVLEASYRIVVTHDNRKVRGLSNSAVMCKLSTNDICVDGLLEESHVRPSTCA